MEIFDICDEKGMPTGKTVERSAAHRYGILHRTAHVWVIRYADGRAQVLLQKRSEDKDSFPGLFDTSSAGHIPAGCEPLDSAIRELGEELGIHAEPSQLTFMGIVRVNYKDVFHGEPFHDNEVIRVFAYEEPVRIEDLTLQKSEVDEVRWFDVLEVYDEIQGESERFCINPKGMKLLVEWLAERE